MFSHSFYAFKHKIIWTVLSVYDMELTKPSLEIVETLNNFERLSAIANFHHFKRQKKLTFSVMRNTCSWKYRKFSKVQFMQSYSVWPSKCYKNCTKSRIFYEKSSEFSEKLFCETRMKDASEADSLLVSPHVGMKCINIYRWLLR